jgi:pSer/pThr/pTyr-binding forkhead associated (FHA) protein
MQAGTPVAPQGMPGYPPQISHCQACRADNPSGMKFCRNCGTQLGGGTPAIGVLVEPPTLMPYVPAPAPAPVAYVPAPVPYIPAPIANSAAPAAAIANAPTPTMPLFCPRCQTSTTVGMLYCQSCGLHLQSVAVVEARPANQDRLRPASHPGNNAGNIGSVSTIKPAAQSLPVDVLAPTSAAVGPSAIRAGSLRSHTSGSVWGFAILVNRDGSDGERFTLQGDLVSIGRSGCDLSFDQDRFLGRPHARLEKIADGVRVLPLDTINGVYRKCDAAVELSDNGMFLVGREVLRFEQVDLDERASAPLVQHGVAMFGSPPREPWGRLLQMLPSGGVRDIRYLVSNEIILGREEGDWVFRDDAFMSRRHASLTWDGRRTLLKDIGSSNGTFARLITTTTMASGDQLRMGDQLLRFELTR